MIHINDLKKIKDDIFKEVIPKEYRGAVGHLIVYEIRKTQDIFEVFNNLKNYPIESEAYYYLRVLNDNQLRQSIAFYSEREKLNPQEKEQLKQGKLYPPIPDPPQSNDYLEWQNYYCQLKKICRERRYKQGWLYHRLRNDNAPVFILELYDKERL